MLLGFYKIAGYLKVHYTEHCDLRFVIPWAALITAAMYFRYSSGVSLEFWWFDYPVSARVLFYSLPFIATVFLYALVYRRLTELINVKAIFLVISICFVLYANQYMLMYRGWLSGVPKEIFSFMSKGGYNIHVSFFFLLIPIIYYLMSWLKGEKLASFYGLTRRGFDYKPYMGILLVSFPFIFWASLQPGFQNMYPRYLPGTAEQYWSVSSWLTVSSYQFTYIVQFITLEIFYRGFIVFALARYLRGGAVWPMVTVYCFLHFTKPFPEAVGAIFGGYLLGVISYYSKSVMGGVMVHVSIALLMELLAYAAIFIW